MTVLRALTADLLNLLGGVFHELVPSPLVGLEDVERLVLLLGLDGLGLDSVHVGV